MTVALRVPPVPSFLWRWIPYWLRLVTVLPVTETVVVPVPRAVTPIPLPAPVVGMVMVLFLILPTRLLAAVELSERSTAIPPAGLPLMLAMSWTSKVTSAPPAPMTWIPALLLVNGPPVASRFALPVALGSLTPTSRPVVKLPGKQREERWET